MFINDGSIWYTVLNYADLNKDLKNKFLQCANDNQNQNDNLKK